MKQDQPTTTMIPKNIKGTGHYPKLPSPTAPGDGTRTLQNIPSPIERERIINKKNQPRKRAPMRKVQIYGSKLPPGLSVGDVTTLTVASHEEIGRIIDVKKKPRPKSPVISILPDTDYVFEQFIPDEIKTGRITEKTTRPRPIAPVQPKEPNQPSAPPSPPPPPEKPKE